MEINIKNFPILNYNQYYDLFKSEEDYLSLNHFYKPDFQKKKYFEGRGTIINELKENEYYLVSLEIITDREFSPRFCGNLLDNLGLILSESFIMGKDYKPFVSYKFTHILFSYGY